MQLADELTIINKGLKTNRKEEYSVLCLIHRLSWGIKYGNETRRTSR